MPRYRVTRSIDFCYGHRLLNYEGECKYLHGHNGRVEIDIEADEPDHRGMVIDFADIRDIAKSWIDANLDHRLILHESDPMVQVLADLGEPHYTIGKNPTAENIAAHICDTLRSERLPIAEIRLWETPNSVATYRPDQHASGA